MKIWIYLLEPELAARLIFVAEKQGYAFTPTSSGPHGRIDGLQFEDYEAARLIISLAEHISRTEGK